MSWLRRLYYSLPVVREVIMTKRVLEDTLTRELRLIKRATQESYLLTLRSQERYQDPRRLLRYEHKVYSQNGEDGAIAEVLTRIGSPERTFAELGVGNGLECNTALLLAQGWKGHWFEGDGAAVADIRRLFARPLASGKLVVEGGLLTRENAASKLRQAGVPTDVDVLSIDLDRNTYWILEGLEDWRPRLLVVEYNPGWPPGVSFVASYDPGGGWDGSYYFGASLTALDRLCRERGYDLVGCDVTGTNAYFVRRDLAGGKFLPPFDAANHYEPERAFVHFSPARERRSFIGAEECRRDGEATGP